MMKVLIAGDFCDNHRVSNLIKKEQYEFIFKNIRNDILSSDYSMVNFEFPIVVENANPILKCGPNLFGNKNSISAIKYAGFSCATLANNHILDQGENNCLITKKMLEGYGMDTVGVGSNLEEAEKILYVEIKGKRLAIINCCEHEFSIATYSTAGANPLNPISQYFSIQEARKNSDYVLVVIHGGHEHFQLPSPRMVETYRFFVDVGADAVVNHHQHCYSGYEVYKGKPIFYGLGNFCFDWEGKRSGTWNEGYMVKIIFEEHISFELIPYLQCDVEPSVLPINKELTKRFYDKIFELNEIISDSDKLHKSFVSFCKDRTWDMNIAVMPYNNRYLRALCNRKLLPTFVNKDKYLYLLNMIECESHLDVFRNYLKKRMC